MTNRVPMSFMVQMKTFQKLTMQPLLLDKTGRPFLDTMKFLNSNVPTVIREKQLGTLYEKYLTLLGGNKKLAAFETAKQEHQLFTKSSSKAVYINLCANFNRKLSSSPIYSEAQRERIGFEYIQATKGQKGNEEGKKNESDANSKKRTADDSIISNSKAEEEPLLKIRKVSNAPINKLDPSLSRTPYLLTRGQLVDEDFPIALTEKEIQDFISLKIANVLVCGRCKKPFQYQFEEKEPKKLILEENCTYHAGKLKKVAYASERKYNCCGEDASAPGCTKGAHVKEQQKYREMIQDGISFHKTKTAPKGTSIKQGELLAIDCEMCYTTQGFDVIRVTIVNEEHKVIYDKLVKPNAPIVDMNTRFSGITLKDLEGITLTLEDVQKELLESVLFEEHILVGHSLSSDLKALRIIHERVIDTSVSYIAPNGSKRSLKEISSKLLKRLIQNEKDGGHDSFEDAIACLELAKLKIQRGPTFGFLI